MREERRTRTVCAAMVLFLTLAGSAAGQADLDLSPAFATFLQTKDFRLDSVPDLYPGGYARISVYARRANLGGMLVDEVWFRLVGVTLDVQALRQGTLRITDYRETAMHARFTLRNLEEYFIAGNAFKDLRLWSDGEFLFGEGTVPFQGLPVKVWLKGFFAVGGTTDVYFYIDNLRVNGLPVLTSIIRRIEAEINPVLTQKTWPATFKIRSLKMTKEIFIVSSQANPNAPCAYCTSGDLPVVAP